MYFQNYHCFVATSNFYLNLLNWFNIQIKIIYFSFKDTLIQFQSTSIKDFTFRSYQKRIIRTTKNLQSMSECVWQLIKCSFKYTIHKFQYFHNLMPVYDGICDENLFKDTTHVHNLSRDSFSELLTTTMPESLILFDQEFYKQQDGVAKGSQLGPWSVNVFLCYHQRIWLQNCPSEFKTAIYRRCVDDTFLLFCSKNNIKKFWNYLNHKHKNIRFTSETKNKD